MDWFSLSSITCHICQYVKLPSALVFDHYAFHSDACNRVGINRPLFSVFETVPINCVHIVLYKPTISGQGHIAEGLIHTSPLKTWCVTRFTRETRGWTGYFLTSCILYITGYSCVLYKRYWALIKLNFIIHKWKET